jgi:hypothetical protein
MRQSRAPTASQIETPPPPPSSTKGGRLFGKSHFGHAFRKGTAGAFGPDLAKKLSQLVKMEKNVMRSMELVGRERMEVAVSYPAACCLVELETNLYSNNSLYGARVAMTMFPT